MLHPQCKALIDDFERRGMPPTYTLSPVEARLAFARRCVETCSPPIAVVETRELTAAGPDHDIPLRLYRPVRDRVLPLAVCLYFHGGGWVVGDLDTHDSLCRQLAHESGCAVVAVHYRLAPEHRFPTAADDAAFALNWVRLAAPSLGLDANRIAIAGDSAGGGLATVVAIGDRDRKVDVAPLRFQLLIYPVTDMRRESASYRDCGQGYLLTRESMDYFVGHYAPLPQHQRDWRASPILHPDLTGLPPTLVVTAGYDPLRDEGQLYAQRLVGAGVPAESVCFDQQIHGFVLMGRRIDDADVAIKLCASRLQRALA